MMSRLGAEVESRGEEVKVRIRFSIKVKNKISVVFNVRGNLD